MRTLLWDTEAAAPQGPRRGGLSSAATRVSKPQKAIGWGHKRSPAVSADPSADERALGRKGEAGRRRRPSGREEAQRRSRDRRRTGSDPVGQPSPAAENARPRKSCAPFGFLRTESGEGGRAGGELRPLTLSL